MPDPSKRYDRRLVVPWGIFGAGNIGDEAVLEGFTKLVYEGYPGLIPTVATHNPEYDAAVAPHNRYYDVKRPGWRARWANRRAQAKAVVGDTPISDYDGDWPLCEIAQFVRTAVRRNQPIAFIGTGTEELQHEKSRSIVANVLAPNAAHWSVRGDRDAQRLLGLGVPEDRITVAADLAWLLPPVSDEFGRDTLNQLGIGDARATVAVNITNEPWVTRAEPKVFGVLAGALDRLIHASDCDVLLVSSETREDDRYDSAALELLRDRMSRCSRAHTLPPHYWTPAQMQSILSACQLVIAARFHLCVLSAIQRTPFIAINRQVKLRDLCFDLDWAYSVDLAADELDQVPLIAKELLGDRLALGEHLGSQVGRLAQRAGDNIYSLQALLGPPTVPVQPDQQPPSSQDPQYPLTQPS